MADDRAVLFHRLSFVPDGDDVVVGRADTRSYAVLPADGAELLRRLSDGMPLADASAWYRETFDEDVDLDDFLESMTELGFVRAAHEQVVAQRPARLRWLGRLVFSVPAWIVGAVLLLAWFVVAMRHADLRPAPSQVYFTGSLLVVQVTLLFGQMPLGLLHEGFHVLAGQRIGLPSRLSISNRFTYVVFETRMALLSVPRKQRYLPLFAGMLADVAVVCVLGLVADTTRTASGALSLTGRVCLALAFTVIARIGWQFLLYLRTDLYYALSTALNCQNLHDASRAIFANRLWRLVRKPARIVDETQWTDRDLRIGQWYGLVIGLGLACAVALTAFMSLPVLVTYVVRTGQGIFSGHLDRRFYDALASLLFIVVEFAIPGYLARRKRRNAPRRPRLLIDSGVV